MSTLRKLRSVTRAGDVDLPGITAAVGVKYEPVKHPATPTPAGIMPGRPVAPPAPARPAPTPPPQPEPSDNDGWNVEGVEADPTQAVPPAPEQPSTRQQVQVRESAAVAAYEPTQADPGMAGEWGADDLRLPSLTIVQGNSGALVARFVRGTVVFADEALLPAPDPRNPAAAGLIRFVPVGMKKSWLERLSMEDKDQGLKPRMFDSEAEVEAAGGTTRWIGNEGPSFSPSARIMLFVARPDTEEGAAHPAFSMSLDGVDVAHGVTYAKNTAYAHIAKPLYNATLTTCTIPVVDEQGQPKKSPNGIIVRRPYLPKYWWTYRAKEVRAGAHMILVPEIRQTRDETGPELRAYLDSFRG